MSARSKQAALLAIDVGSSRLKFGWFPTPRAYADSKPSALQIASAPLPEPAETLQLAHGGRLDPEAVYAIEAWADLHLSETANIAIATVYPEVGDEVAEIFAAHRPLWLRQADVPVQVNVDSPEKVGVDRLLNALAVNWIRDARRAAIVADLGTATTVDLISAEGVFLGGAILPGMAMGAAALHRGTATLPLLDTGDEPETPLPLGKATEAAIASGIYWGAVGAVRELAAHYSAALSEPPQFVLTGGDALRVVEQFQTPDGLTRLVPQLTLSGIVLAVGQNS